MGNTKKLIKRPHYVVRAKDLRRQVDHIDKAIKAFSGPGGGDGHIKSQTRIKTMSLQGDIVAPTTSNATVYLSTSLGNGNFFDEKWWDITTIAQDNESVASPTQVACQADDNGDGILEVYYGGDLVPTPQHQGVVTDMPITLPGGSSFWFNAYDRYDDTWDGHNWEIRTEPNGGGTLLAFGNNPDDGLNDGGGQWLIGAGAPGTKFESTTQFTMPAAPSGGGDPNPPLTVLSVNSDGIERPLHISFTAASTTHEVVIRGLMLENLGGATQVQIHLGEGNVNYQEPVGEYGKTWWQIAVGGGEGEGQLALGTSYDTFLLENLVVGQQYDYYFSARCTTGDGDVKIIHQNITPLEVKTLYITEEPLNITEYPAE